MPKLSSIVATATLASALAGPVLADSKTALTQTQMNARVTDLCNNPSVKAKLVQPDEVCQVSPDGGKTWIWVPVGLVALLGSGFIVYRRRSMSTSTKNPEPEEKTGANPEPEEKTGANPEPEEKTGANPEPEEKTGANPESEHRTAQSKWENIHQDISYSVNDAHNAKTILRRLISKHRAGHDGSSTPEQTANSAYLNKLLHDLKTQDINKKRITIQVIFAIAKFEKLDNIPNPIY